MGRFLFAFFISSLTLLTLRIGQISTVSIDFATHLSLVHYITVNMHIPSGQVNSYLGAMTNYPPLAHVLGSIFGFLVHSDLLGMNACALLSVLFFYTFWTSMLVKEGAYRSCGFFFIAIVLLSKYKLSQGGELLGNYFYAQMVGSAGMLALVYLSMIVTSGWKSLVLSILGSVALGYIYPLSEIQYASSVIIFMILSEIQAISENSFAGFRKVAIFAVVLGILSVAHPAFHVMTSIAKNDGGMANDLSLGVILSIAGVLLSVSLLIYYFHRRSSSVLGKTIVSISISVALVAVIQYLALILFDLGSPYAVKKHIYDLCTYLVIVLSYGSGMVFPRINLRNSTNHLQLALWPNAMSLLIVLLMFWFEPSWNVEKFLLYQDYASEIMDHELPPDAYGSTVSLNDNLVPNLDLQKVMNYSVSLLQLGSPQWPASLAYFDIAQPLVHKNGVDWVRYAIVNAGGAFAEDTNCLITKPSHLGLVAVDYKCSTSTLGEIVLGKAVNAGIDGNIESYLVSGWSWPESKYVWSDGNSAKLQFKLREQPEAPTDLIIDLYLGAFLTAQHPQQRVEFTVNGQLIGTRILEIASLTRHVRLEVTPKMIRNGVLTLELTLPDAISPKDAGVGADTRKLAVSLKSFVVERP